MKLTNSGYCYICHAEKTEEVYEFGSDLEDNFCWVCGDCMREKIKSFDILKKEYFGEAILTPSDGTVFKILKIGSAIFSIWLFLWLVNKIL